MPPVSDYVSWLLVGVWFGFGAGMNTVIVMRDGWPRSGYDWLMTGVVQFLWPLMFLLGMSDG